MGKKESKIRSFENKQSVRYAGKCWDLDECDSLCMSRKEERVL